MSTEILESHCDIRRYWDRYWKQQCIDDAIGLAIYVIWTHWSRDCMLPGDVAASRYQHNMTVSSVAGVVDVQCQWRCTCIVYVSTIHGTLAGDTAVISQQTLRFSTLAYLIFSERELTYACRPSVCRLSVCNVRAPYSGGSNFPQYFYDVGTLAIH